MGGPINDHDDLFGCLACDVWQDTPEAWNRRTNKMKAMYYPSTIIGCYDCRKRDTCTAEMEIECTTGTPNYERDEAQRGTTPSADPNGI